MKKVIIALVLVALIALPVFADRKSYYGAEVSAKFAVDADGVKIAGIGIYGTREFELRQEKEDSPKFNGKLGYVFSLDKEPAVSGVYVEVVTENSFGASIPTALIPTVSFGVAADFHMVDGEFKVNLAPVAGFAVESEIAETSKHESKVGAGLSVKYVLLNNTGVTPFSFDVKASLRPSMR